MKPAPIILAPGFARVSSQSMLNAGRALRDEYLWEYPILPGAVYTFQQMAAGREWSVSGTEKGAPRAVEWLHQAVSRTATGLEQHGLDTFLQLRVLDYLSVGRTLLRASENGPLEYLDPAYTHYVSDKGVWYNALTQEEYPKDEIYVDHPIPIGGAGLFVSPLSFVVPSAMLAWLLREHDRASLDGRKIRDVIVVYGQELAAQIDSAIQQMINIWSGADPAKVGVPVVYTENSVAAGKSASDLITTMGISKIPSGFDRSGFEFAYVNEIAAALGISLRHFWNSEKATNRALEEVQEARQAQKGPSAFVRREQRILNTSGVLKRFGSRTRMAFEEEVDVQSRETNAKVLKLYAESLVLMSNVFGGTVNGEAFLAWLQGEGILPADLTIITDLGALEQSDSLPTPQGILQRRESDPDPSPVQKSEPLDYDEITLSMDGRVLDKRRKVFTIHKILEEKLLSDPETLRELIEEPKLPTFTDLLVSARKESQKALAALWERSPQFVLEIAENEFQLNKDGVVALLNTDPDDLTQEQQLAVLSLANRMVFLNDIDSSNNKD